MQTTKWRASVYFFIAAFLSVSLMACGGGGGGGSAQVNPTGLLQGNNAALAIPQITAYDNSQGVEDSNVVIAPAPDGRHIALTQLEIWIDADATVGEVNEALQSVDALIISMIPNVPILLIEIDRPADFTALQGIADQLLAFDAINKVDFVSMSSPDSLPSNIGPDDIAALNKSYQLIATKSFAARNAKVALASTLSEPPTIIIADFFGDGTPGAQFDIVTDSADYNLFSLNSHGYHVLGIISALDGGSSTVTGAYPDTAFIKAVDIQLSTTKQLSNTEWQNRVLLIMYNNPRKYVVNSSIGSSCSPNGFCSDDILRADGFKFITKVRDAGLENNYLHVNSAGNTPGPTYAYQDNERNYAALRTDITDDQGNAVSPLTNVITVENVAITSVSAESDPSKPICLSSGSVSGGHISAPGYLITSFVDANGAEDRLSGTSMAAPMVTAVAAYLWALAPDLSPQVLKQRLINSAEPVTLSEWEGCADVAPQPFLDAYRTILTADNQATLENTDPVAGRIRGTILDVSGEDPNYVGSNGQFDELDIDTFLYFFDEFNGKLDYSEFDLNGDGYTGGGKTSKFDLDMNRSIEQQVSQTIGGDNIDFDENAVSDMGILCYYAYSKLYTGDTDIRDHLIGNECGMDDCIYTVATYNPEAPLYFKYCRRYSVPGIIQLTHSSNNGLHTIRLEQQVCNEPQYTLNDECPSDNFNSKILMMWSEGYEGSTISLTIEYLNNLNVYTNYNCGPYGDEFELKKSPSDPGTNGDIGQYATLDACYTALKAYIPQNPSVFEYPGDCHDWWDNAGETCI